MSLCRRLSLKAEFHHDVYVAPLRSAMMRSQHGSLGRYHPVHLHTKIRPNERTPGLLEEGILPTLRDAQARLLSPGYVSIPDSAEVWAFCCESSEFHEMSRLLPQAAGSSGNDFLPPSSDKWECCPGAASPASVRASFRPLSPSVRIFEFEFSSHGDPLPGPQGRKRGVRFPIDRGGGGTIHAVVCWWRCFMDKDRKITMSTSPLDKDAPSDICTPPEEQPAADAAPFSRDHWRQSVYLLSRPLRVQAGDAVCAFARHDDTAVWFHAIELETHSAGSDQDAVAVAASCEASATEGPQGTRKRVADTAKTASLLQASVEPASAASEDVAKLAPEAEAATAPTRRESGEEVNLLTREEVARAPKDPRCPAGLRVRLAPHVPAVAYLDAERPQPNGLVQISYSFYSRWWRR